MTSQQQRQHDQVRRADAVVRSVTVDALRKTAVLLAMIADGTVDPAVAGPAAADLMSLLDAMEQAERAATILRQSQAPVGPTQH